jgi:hypothetical protein
MNLRDVLFSGGPLADVLNIRLSKISNAVATWNEDSLLSTPESDICEALNDQFLVEPVVLDRNGITADDVEDGSTNHHEFGDHVRVVQTMVTISVPFTGDRQLLTLQPNNYTSNPPRGSVRDGELKIYWVGGGQALPDAVRQGLYLQLNDIARWLEWSTAQVTAYNEAARQRIATEVQARKARVLANRSLQTSLGFPMRKRSDADTYAVPITRKRIVPRRTAPTSGPFQPEPALDDAQYEAALSVLRNQRNQLERSPSLSTHFGEEQIRDLLLIGLNSQFEGRAAGEVFNNTGKTDILIREGDRHIFIGECKFWRGPKTITDTLDQLLRYMVWRDTKAALLLFIRTGNPTDVIAKAVDKFPEHPNYKRAGQHATDERHDFVFHANEDPNREIKLAFLPFQLPEKTPGS